MEKKWRVFAGKDRFRSMPRAAGEAAVILAWRIGSFAGISRLAGEMVETIRRVLRLG